MKSQLPVRTYIAAGGVVVEPSQEFVLVLVRSGRLGPQDKPEVRLPKGHVEPGESHQQSALREVTEESGLSGLRILAELGQQVVEFDWQEHHYMRHEFYFLMAAPTAEDAQPPEAQFQRNWLTWDNAEEQLTFRAEREWVRRARRAWAKWRQTGGAI